jgi:transitional endoplasmic reticulum ATPase
MNNLFKGLEELIELAKTLEEKIEKGEVVTDVRVNTYSSISRQGNIPRRPSTSPTSPTPEPEVIVTPPPRQQGSRGEQERKPEGLAKVGGLGEVVRELRELLEIPLKRPELLRQMGLEAPRGVLMVGLPGTGKTLTARSLAESLGVNYIAINGPEIMGKYYGEAEGRLRSLFEKAARSAPCSRPRGAVRNSANSHPRNAFRCRSGLGGNCLIVCGFCRR